MKKVPQLVTGLLICNKVTSITQNNKIFKLIFLLSGALNETNLELFTLSGPPYTEIQANVTQILLNKGNIAPIYTKLLNDNPDINGLEIRDLVLQEQEKAEEDKLDLLNKNTIKPFDWSESVFVNSTHEGLPDRWAFELYAPKWTW